MAEPVGGELDAGRLHLVSTVLAIACGLTAANLYYAQPLLDLLARTFGVSEGSAAVVVTATQLGYAAGMIVLLPLGDLFENRALAGRMLVGTAVALVAAGLAPTFGLFLVASVAVGMTSSVTQILVPVAARLAPPGARGRFIVREESKTRAGTGGHCADHWELKALWVLIPRVPYRFCERQRAVSKRLLAP